MEKIEFIGKPYGEGPKGAWASLALPPEFTRAADTKGRVPIVLTVGGKTFRVSAFPDGKDGHIINFNKAMQAAGRAGPGDAVRLAVEVDTKARTVAVPKDLKAALARAPRAKATFDGLAPSHRKAYVGWIEDATKPETRAKRVGESVVRLSRGEKFW